MAGGSKDDHAKPLEALSSGSSSVHEDRVHEQAPQQSVPENSPLPAGNVRRPDRPDPAPAVATSARPVVRAGITDRALELKRTAIPLLLTLGTVLPLAGLASILMGEESLLGEERALPIVMIALGLLILGAGIMTMLQVKHLLSARAH